MTKTKAIKQYCYECSGSSHKDTILCHIFDCPLWQFRLGCKITSPTYKKRMDGAIRRYPDDIQTFVHGDVKISQFYEIPINKTEDILTDAEKSDLDHETMPSLLESAEKTLF